MNTSFLQALEKLLHRYKALESENIALKKEIESLKNLHTSEVKKKKKQEKKEKTTIKSEKTPSLF